MWRRTLQRLSSAASPVVFAVYVANEGAAPVLRVRRKLYLLPSLRLSQFEISTL